MNNLDRRNGVTDGLAIKAPCVAATTAEITLFGLQTVDGVVLAEGDRVLVKNQADPTANGVYVAHDSLAWSRDLDFDGYRDAVNGTFIPVAVGGTVNGNGGSLWQLSATNPVSFGTTALSFVSAITATSMSFLQAGTGAVARTVQNKERDIRSAKDFGAVGDGATDDSAAVQLSLNTGDTFFDSSTYKTGTAPTGNYSWVSFGGSFSGANPVDGAFPAFGPGALRAASVGGLVNGIIGLVRNSQAANTSAFPTAVTACARNDNDGNTAFGIYAPAYQYATKGVATNEIDSFNMTAAPSTNLPPNRAIGTTQNIPVALTVAAGGSFNSAIGIHIDQEGSSPRSFLTGIFFGASSCTTWGIYNNCVVPNYLAGTLGIGTAPDANSNLKVSSGGVTAAASFASAGGTSTVTLTDLGSNGVNLNFAGNGATTPNKTIRVISGHLQVVNSGYAAAILDLADSGDLHVYGQTLETSKTVTATNGLTTYTASTKYNYLTGTAGASFAITLPAAAAGIDGEIIVIMATANRAATTWTSTGATFVGAPAALTANTPVKLQYDHGTTAWYITA